MGQVQPGVIGNQWVDEISNPAMREHDTTPVSPGMNFPSIHCGGNTYPCLGAYNGPLISTGPRFRDALHLSVLFPFHKGAAFEIFFLSLFVREEEIAPL